MTFIRTSAPADSANRPRMSTSQIGGDDPTYRIRRRIWPNSPERQLLEGLLGLIVLDWHSSLPHRP